MKLEKRLKALNKPFIKTILTKEGDVIDCVRHYDQPAFDHPALKNHKIQLRPTSFPFDHHQSSSTERSSAKEVHSIPLRGTRESCPDASVPIKRTTKQDLLAADSLLAPSNNEATSYKNNRDNSGCYNTQCPGFVQVDKQIPINYAFQKTSVAGNNDLHFSILETTHILDQDEQTGNWWLTVSKDNVNVGYWPKELFQDLANGAHVASWGGQTFPGSNGQFPPMGNGNKPSGLYRDTCYFDAIKYYGGGQSYDITPSEVDRYVSGSDCYDLQLTEHHEPLDITPFAFTFGGPGGTCTA
uniref:Neprosin PEP catalytic domain-containing protein n=1 Tax=Kalanchoe fedtschenkoi TaxID=63787 RepID=A0A7N0VBL7_KALFE